MSNYIISNGELYHHGIKGQKWGVRRYQNKDGSLTPAGRKRYSPDRLSYPEGASRTTKRVIDDYNSMDEQQFMNKYSGSKDEYSKRVVRYGDPYKNPKGKTKYVPKHLDYPGKATDVTKKVIDDYNSMDDQQFMNKYAHSKEKYAKQVAKYGDPYLNSKVARKRAEKVGKMINKVGMAYLTDQVFYSGMGTKLAKETVNAMGRATITAYKMANGGYDIKWYDKNGRRVG